MEWREERGPDHHHVQESLLWALGSSSLSHLLQGVFSLGKMPCCFSLYMLGAFFALEIEGTEIGGL